MMRNILVLLCILYVHTSYGQITRSLGEVRELEVTDRIQVKLIPSDDTSLEIYGDLADQVQVVQSGDVLRLKMSTSNLLQGNEVTVKLHVRSLFSMTARKGAEIEQQGTFLKADTMNISASEGARIIAKLEVTGLKASINAGGILELSGVTKNLSANVLAGGSLFGRNLKANVVTARTNAGGRCEVFASHSIDAQTRAGGVIDVYGKPANTKEKKVAGGKINYL